MAKENAKNLKTFKRKENLKNLIALKRKENLKNLIAPKGILVFFPKYQEMQLHISFFPILLI